MAAAIAASLGIANDAASENVQLRKCAKRVSHAVQIFSQDYLAKVGKCHIDNLKDRPDLDCERDPGILRSVDDMADRSRRLAKKCKNNTLRALCPFSSEDPTDLKEAMRGGQARGLGDLLDQLFTEDNGPSCPRPAPRVGVSRVVEDCAKRMDQAVREAVKDLQKCFFKCMKSEIKTGRSDCIDEAGFPVTRSLTTCVEKAFKDFSDEFAVRCHSDSYMMSLGCPMGASTVQGAMVMTWSALYANVRDTNRRLFQSPCRRPVGGGGSTPPPRTPAAVTLLPSGRSAQVNCGDALGPDFFGSDTTLRFNQDLDCRLFGGPTDGIVVATSGVTIEGNARKRSLIGPNGGKNRTGAGIRLAPGATNIRIKDFKGIESFGIGIHDSGDNEGLQIDRITVRRNAIAGIRTTSPQVDIEDVVADRNAVGFDLSGDDTMLRKVRSRRNGPEPGYGIYLNGADSNGNGRAVFVKESLIEDNVVGVWAEGSGHRIDENSFRGNTMEGAVIAGTAIRLDDSGFKHGGADGVLVSGDFNRVKSCRSEQNLGAGFVVTGTGNELDGNGSGNVTNLGNGGAGFLLLGTDNVLTSNRAEANLGGGYSVAAPNVLRNNRAYSNEGVGFHITGTGSGLETNVAEANVGPEFVIGPGNLNLNGNRANGRTFSFGSSGGTFE